MREGKKSTPHKNKRICLSERIKLRRKKSPLLPVNFYRFDRRQQKHVIKAVSQVREIGKIEGKLPDRLIKFGRIKDTKRASQLARHIFAKNILSLSRKKVSGSCGILFVLSSHS